MPRFCPRKAALHLAAAAGKQGQSGSCNSERRSQHRQVTSHRHCWLQASSPPSGWLAHTPAGAAAGSGSPFHLAIEHEELARTLRREGALRFALEHEAGEPAGEVRGRIDVDAIGPEIRGAPRGNARARPSCRSICRSPGTRRGSRAGRAPAALRAERRAARRRGRRSSRRHSPTWTRDWRNWRCCGGMRLASSAPSPGNPGVASAVLTSMR